MTFRIHYPLFLPLLLLFFCKSKNPVPAAPIVAVLGDNLPDRFPAPAGFVRVPQDSLSFGAWLRRLPLKPPGAPVQLFDGRLKSNQNIHAAVVEMDIGDKDLQQCADASIRLWAEYLFAQKKYSAIHFNLTNGFRVDFEKWAQGYRVQVLANQTWWVKSKAPSDSYPTFRAYLDFVFRYAGSLSLSNELPAVPIQAIQGGDIFIQGGSPGHVVVVLDVAKNPETGAICALLGQSFMPAQDFHVLKNPQNATLSPWFAIGETSAFATPEWVFKPLVVRRF
jgi:hypothetical protein